MVFARAASRSLRPSTFSSLASASPQFASRAAQPSIRSTIAKRTLTASASRQGKVLLVLYDVGGTHIPNPLLLRWLL
jgi:formate dehydrogenase